tara:strand:+ start:305 stop:487 length:183 start_codon:yes stop_codon:yes gene_type:complete
MKIKTTAEEIDKFLIGQLCSDMSRGDFYTEIDDDTLSIALETIYMDIYLWMDRGVIIGEA